MSGITPELIAALRRLSPERRSPRENELLATIDAEVERALMRVGSPDDALYERINDLENEVASLEAELDELRP